MNELVRVIYDDALLAHRIAQTVYGRLYAATKGLRLLEDSGYHGPLIDKLSQMVLDARAEAAMD